MPLPPNLLNEAATCLKNHQEALRIKKVIFCLSKKYWENNPIVLSAFTESALIEKLLENYPTLDEFKTTLVKLIKTLNRPNVYTEIGKVVFEQISRLYKYLESEPEPQTAIVVPTAIVPASSPEIVYSIANSLETHQEEARIKKVIYSVCRRRWENDVQLINSYSLQSLINELIRTYPTKESLHHALIKLVQNINKQNLYLAIANIIVERLAVLYNNEETNFLPVESNAPVINHQYIQVNHSYHFSSAAAAQQFVPQAAVAQVSAVEESRDREPEFIAPEVHSQPKSIKIFDLRLEIVQYTNPLRAKVLLFSVLYQSWDKNNQDWTMLRSYTLDDLLKELIQTHKAIEDIETKLFGAARVLNDFESNLQTASTIVEAIKPYMTNN
jgi:hypothetical protein